MKQKNIAYLFLVITFLLYGNTLFNKYALDDEYVTVTNFKQDNNNYEPNHALVKKGFRGIPKIWKTRYAHDSEASFDYRPLVTTTFAIEYGIFGQNPFISHLINLLLYFTVSFVLFLTLQKLFVNYDFSFTLSFLCSFIFLIHPAHSEVVNNIKCRDELLALLFCLLALKNSLHYFDKASVKSVILIFLFLALGLFCKKTSILSFGIIPLCLIFYRSFKTKTTVLIASVFIISLLTFVLIRASLMTEKSVRYFYHFENPLFTDHFNIIQRVFVALKTLGFYVKFLLFPYPFRFYYGANTIDLYSFDVNAIIGFLFIAGASFYAYKLKSRHFFFAILLFLISIFPFLNFATPVAGIVGERLSFFSTVGFCLLLVIIFLIFFPKVSITNTKQFYVKPLVYLFPLFIICFFYIFNRNKSWYDKLTLFEHDAPYLENSAKANSLLGNEYFEMLRAPKKKYPMQTIVAKSLKHYQLALSNDSSLYAAFNNTGALYFSYMNNPIEAKKYFMLAIKHKEKYAQATENLGNVYKAEQKYDSAIVCYQKAIEYNSKQYNSAFEIVNCLIAQKKYSKAINICDFFLKIFVDDYGFIVQKANCFFLLNKKDEAKLIYELAYQIKPNDELRSYINSLESK